MKVEPAGINTAIVTGAIRQAARMTGADFKYLLATAQVESSLNPNARASTSSARGLFQFTEQTWLATLKEQGTALGYGPYADAISRDASGDYVVPDLRMSSAVMNLRSDPTANSLIAGAFTRTNGAKLAARLGRDPTEGELYIAHFLGPNGASRLIGLADTSPLTPAATVFPGPARANPTIFYNGRGNTRSASEVYRLLVGRYDVARAGPEKATAVVANAGGSAPVQSAFAPDTAGLTETYAAAARLSPGAQVRDIAAVFHGLFRSGGEVPVAPLVSSLWTSPQSPEASHAPASAPVAGAGGSPLPAVEGRGELSLFQDQAPDARALFRGPV